MNGIILADKPSGITSFGVVARVRRLCGEKKVGHSGTLDPLATGLLPLFIGRATKSIKYFIGGDKGYEGEMTLGVTTDTLDSEGKITGGERIDKALPCLYTVSLIQDIFKKYTGKQMQTPPMFSAKKIAGQRLYQLARAGKEIEVPPKPVEIYRFEFLGLQENKIKFRVFCSKGTYVRVLVSEVGQELGCGAHLSALRRIYAHPFMVSQAFTLEAINDLAQAGKLNSIVLPVEGFLAEKCQLA